MNSTLSPELHQIYLFDRYSLLYIESGDGRLEIDFATYTFAQHTLISLAPGQYIKLISGQYIVHVYQYQQDDIMELPQSRVLFQHLISVGHIDLNLPINFRLKTFRPAQTTDGGALLQTSISDWIELNPFNSSPTERDLLFDLKEIIDQKYREPVSISDVSKLLLHKPHTVKQVAREKLNQTIHQFATRKLLLEARRKVVFTRETTREIAYELGFKDPAYFNRFFLQHNQLTPTEFRQKYEYAAENSFAKQLTDTIDEHFRFARTAAFYAHALYMTVPTLQRKTVEAFGTTLHSLIRERRITEAKAMLQAHVPVRTVAYALGFQEANHFSAFFKKYTSVSPTAISSISE